MKKLLLLLFPLIDNSTIFAMDNIDITSSSKNSILQHYNLSPSIELDLEKHFSTLLSPASSPELDNAKDKAVKVLKNELNNPNSNIWNILGKTVGTESFDKLPESSKHLDLLNGRLFLQTGGLDLFFLWNGQDFYQTNRISVRDYIRNLQFSVKPQMQNVLGLSVNDEKFDPLNFNPNLDSPYLLEDHFLNEEITKWVTEENEQTGKGEVYQILLFAQQSRSFLVMKNA